MTAINASTRTQHPVHYKTVRVSDLDIFYREAESANRPCDFTFARVSNFVQHVSKSHSTPRRLISRGGARLSRLRPEQYARSPELCRTHSRI